MRATFAPPPGFKGLWIPACIQLDLDLHPLQKMVLAEIYQLQRNKDERCWASNAHLCRIVCTSERNLRYLLAPLEERGLLLRQSRTSKRRKLIVAKHVAEAIKADSQQPVTSLRVNQPPADEPPPSAMITNEATDVLLTVSNERLTVSNEDLTVRNEIAILTYDPAISDSESGNLRTDPATECRLTRQATATENTLRVQREKTDKRTTNNNMGNLDFSSSRKNASTHVLDKNGRRLSSLEWWDRWKGGYEACVDDPLDEAEAIEHLARMVSEGFDGDQLLRACANTGAHRFWDEPPRGVIPKQLRPSYGYAW